MSERLRNFTIYISVFKIHDPSRVGCQKDKSETNTRKQQEHAHKRVSRGHAQQIR